MDKKIKPFLRGFLSKFKPFRELAFLLFQQELKDKFLVVSRRDIDAYMLIDTSDSYGIDVLKRGKIESSEDEFIKKILKPNFGCYRYRSPLGRFFHTLWETCKGRGKGLLFRSCQKKFQTLKVEYLHKPPKRYC